MGSVDELTFNVNFSSEGTARLRQRIRDRLKEFMGEYTDDTLVEYVIVLLRNGRSKEEARTELNVFLGDDSDYFISWLWDHLSSELNTYTCPPESPTKELSKSKTTEGNGNLVEHNEPVQLDAESERGKPMKLSRNHHNRDWKGLARDTEQPPPLRSAVVDDTDLREKSHRKVSHRRRSPSPHKHKHKRTRDDEQQNITREEASKATINAPRRLLQFAVRDAVENSRPKGPFSKRLRSVVATSTEKVLLANRPQRVESISGVPNPMSTVIKAVAEAAEDVTKVRSSRSVFDRIGRGADASESASQQAQLGDFSAMDEEYGHSNQAIEDAHSRLFQRNEYRGQGGKIEALDAAMGAMGVASDFMSDNEECDDFTVVSDAARDPFQPGTASGRNGDDSLTVKYSVAKRNQVMQDLRNKNEEQPLAGVQPSQKIVNISVNVNAWKPSQYQEVKEASDFDSQKSKEIRTLASKSALQLQGSAVATVNGNTRPIHNIQQGYLNMQQPSSGSQSAAQHTEDAELRTIFVSNVHFAATKERLTRHFNKFGDVLKVVILADGATGQPKGSAYIEFMQKEAAESALSLDGTSFMSRILKVLKKQAAPADATTPATPWPRIARSSIYASPRFPRAPFGRGMSAAFRPFPLKAGARSMQWKRDAQASPAKSGAPVLANSGLSSARSLTYVRTPTKTDGNGNAT